MAEVRVEMRGVEYSTHLANTLTDLEFELLVRIRVKDALKKISVANPNLSESHHRVMFRYSVTDESTWEVHVGENYNKYKDATGAVMSLALHDAVQMMQMEARNKMSLLLPKPGINALHDAINKDNTIPF